MEYSSAKVGAPSLLAFFRALLYFWLMTPSSVLPDHRIITPENLGASKAPA
jgi:hypothetical protein